MIIVELTGGLGNQMFQYALAIKLKSMGRNVCIDPLFDEDSLRKYELTCFNGVIDDYIPMVQKSGASENSGIIQKIIQKIIVRCTPDYKDRIIVFQPEVFRYRRVRLSGYWQNEKYFADIRDEILKRYSIKDDRRSQYKKAIADKYGDQYEPEKENSISVHVRRTDYNDPNNKKYYGDICTKEYYKKAIKFYSDRFENAVFYYFSDDIGWVKDNLFPEIETKYPGNHRIIDLECDDVADLWMMTRCRHHIIANSTYSWWGAWLGQNEDKLVIAPSKWMNGYSDDIICADWIKV